MSANVIVPLIAVAVAVAVLTGALVIWPLQRVFGQTARGAPTLWAGLVIAPLGIALLVVVALLLPAPFGICHCAAHGPHHHPHLCWMHPQLASSLVLPAAAMLVAWSVLAAPALWRVVKEARATARWTRETSGQAVAVDGLPVWVARCGSPNAVAAGALRPRILFDRELWSRLDDEERRAIVHHEHAHVLRADGLTLLALRAAAALYLVPWAASCIERWRTSAELACDRHASSALGDPLAVASTLLSVERAGKSSEQAAARAVLAARPGTLLEVRVRALLESEHPQAARLANDLLLIGCALCTLAFVVAVWPDDSVHHALETLIGWMFH